jgi:hypothetical protein
MYVFLFVCLSVLISGNNQVRIGQETLRLVQGLCDRIELWEYLRETLSQYPRDNRTRGSYGTLAGTPNFSVQLGDLHSATSTNDSFDTVVQRLCGSMENCEWEKSAIDFLPIKLSVNILPNDEESPPTSRCTTNYRFFASQTSLGTPSNPRNSRQSLIHLPLNLPSQVNLNSWRPSSAFGQPQVSVTPGPQPIPSGGITTRHATSPAPRMVYHQSNRPSTYSTSATHRTLLPLEASLSTRVPMIGLSVWSPPNIIEATMETLIQHLLLNPTGELQNINLCAPDFKFTDTFWVETDSDKHDTFFIGHMAFISQQGVLVLLIRRFDEAAGYPDDVCNDTRAKCGRPLWVLHDSLTLFYQRDAAHRKLGEKRKYSNCQRCPRQYP